MCDGGSAECGAVEAMEVVWLSGALRRKARLQTAHSRRRLASVWRRCVERSGGTTPPSSRLVDARRPDPDVRGAWRAAIPEVLKRFTDRAREVVVLAREEARHSGQRNIGTEHVLLGLVDQDDGIAVHVLHSFGVTANRVHDEIRVQHPWMTGERFEGQIPFTPRAASVLELLRRESERVSHPMIGPEHLLLGLIAANNRLALTLLSTFGVDPAAVNQAVDQILPTAGGPALARRDRAWPETNGSIDSWLPIPPSQPVRRLLLNAAGSADIAER